MTLNKYFKDIIFLASNINNLMINVMLIYPDIYIYILKKKIIWIYSGFKIENK
jgi:hypothetical protein